LLHCHNLLVIAPQRSRRVSLGSQTLDRIRDPGLIGRKSVSDCRVIVNMLRHHVEDLGEAGQCYKCRIEALLLRSLS